MWPFVHRIVTAGWFKEVIEPEYVMDGVMRSNPYLNLSHVTVRGLLSGFKREGDALVSREWTLTSRRFHESRCMHASKLVFRDLYSIES